MIKIKSVFYNNSSTFIDSNKTKNNSLYSSKSLKSLFTIDEKNAVNSIVNKFKKNKSVLSKFMNKEKKMELNSLTNMTNKSLIILLDDNQTKEKKNKTINNGNNSLILSSKMINLFHVKKNNTLY